jgi:hypothetical protein
MFDLAANFLKQYLEIPESWAPLPIPPSMNLVSPPWYHGRLYFLAHPTRQSAPVVNNKDSVSTKPIIPAKVDSEAMGMTKEQQQEIQLSLFKMLG